jgi:hypothetical protein
MRVGIGFSMKLSFLTTKCGAGGTMSGKALRRINVAQSKDAAEFAKETLTSSSMGTWRNLHVICLGSLG